MTKRTVIVPALVIYAALAGILSYCQFDYISADFVAYVSIARRTIEQPWCAITTYWSSLFSWIMTPLLYVGVNDLIAGRIVLLVSGVFYLLAIYRLTVIHSKTNSETDRLIQVGTMTCAVVHASIWANYLLAPDLLANAFLYSYFCLVSDRQFSEYRPKWAFRAGLMAGMAYLAKAYMLPFCLLHVVLTTSIDWITRDTRLIAAHRVKTALAMLCLFGLGLGLLAGPWIACLSWKSGRPTFSTAGSANHANMSPDNFRKDPLWNPGLTQDFIFEPRLAPDWSAFQDLAHFQHQMSIVTYNVLNCIGLIPIWLFVFFVGLLSILLSKRKVDRTEFSYFCWVMMTVLVYCGGYTVVNLEARYIIPTVVPLLCHASLMMFRSWMSNKIVVNGSEDSFGRRVAPSFGADRNDVVVLFMSGVDLHNLIRVATVHPQANRMQEFRVVADELYASGIADVPCACNHWHYGLYIAYAANRLSNYWGSPLARTESQAANEMNSKEVKVYLRFVSDSDESNNTIRVDPFIDDRSWTRTVTIRSQEFAPKHLEVYERR
jgi:hypothetical protein